MHDEAETKQKSDVSYYKKAVNSRSRLATFTSRPRSSKKASSTCKLSKLSPIGVKRKNKTTTTRIIVIEEDGSHARFQNSLLCCDEDDSMDSESTIICQRKLLFL
jgi:hypothetical protein